MNFVSYKLCKLFVFLMCFQMFLVCRTISRNLYFPPVHSIFKCFLQNYCYYGSTVKKNAYIICSTDMPS
jgi:hypothetical protein